MLLIVPMAISAFGCGTVTMPGRFALDPVVGARRCFPEASRHSANCLPSRVTSKTVVDLIFDLCAINANNRTQPLGRAIPRLSAVGPIAASRVC